MEIIRRLRDLLLEIISLNCAFRMQLKFYVVILVYLISFTVSLIIILAKKNILGTFTCQRSNNVEINVFPTSQTTGTSFTSEMTFLVFPFFQISSDLKTWLRSLISANQNVDGKSRKIKIEI